MCPIFVTCVGCETSAAAPYAGQNDSGNTTLQQLRRQTSSKKPYKVRTFPTALLLPFRNHGVFVAVTKADWQKTIECLNKVLFFVRFDIRGRFRAPLFVHGSRLHRWTHHGDLPLNALLRHKSCVSPPNWSHCSWTTTTTTATTTTTTITARQVAGQVATDERQSLPTTTITADNNHHNLTFLKLNSDPTNEQRPHHSLAEHEHAVQMPHGNAATNVTYMQYHPPPLTLQSAWCTFSVHTRLHHCPAMCWPHAGRQTDAQSPSTRPQ